MVTFFKSFLPLKDFGMDFRFRAIDDFSRAHRDETEFNAVERARAKHAVVMADTCCVMAGSEWRS